MGFVALGIVISSSLTNVNFATANATVDPFVDADPRINCAITIDDSTLTATLTERSGRIIVGHFTKQADGGYAIDASKLRNGEYNIDSDSPIRHNETGE